ncbi:MAG: glycoside hydrolase family 43 protein [Anaerolineae bacterium]|nr:glycoside hydrolase family 43 protein [Anaerolineae bacterium]
MKYNNPVIPGFYPDPSVCRVGEDYYLVTSTFEYFPGVPVFHSRDLVHWRQIDHCLTRKSQLPLEGARSSGGIYAPTIRYHDGTFYMVTTNVTGGGHFYVHTQDPYGEWSEPVWVEGVEIDPSLFFDDDGKVYFTYKAWKTIYQKEIDIETGQALTESKPLWAGTGGQHPEGPHLYKIDGRYYLMLAEGGTSYGHMETIARSETPWGPFEGCPHNPILTHRSTDSPIQATGHAELFQAHDGSWWMVFLGIRPHRSYHNLGRETFLAPVSWTDDGWPIVGQNGMASLEMEAQTLPLHPWDEESARDDFDEPNLWLCWNSLRNPHPEDWSLSDRPGWLRLMGSAIGLDAVDSPAWIGRRQRHFDCRAATLLDFGTQNDGEEAGLTAFMNELHHYEIAITRLEGERCVIVRRRIGSLSAIVAWEKVGPGPVTLEIQADREMYTFSYAMGGQKPRALAQGETRYLSTEVASGFTGVYFAMYATGNGQASSMPAFFDWFEYKPLE